MPKLSSVKKYAKVRTRFLDLANSHRQQIEKNDVVRISAVFLGEAEWLVKEMDRFVNEAVLPEAEPELETEEESVA